MPVRKKHTFPVDDARKHLEPSPIVLVSSASGGKANIMTMGWHMIMGMGPSLFGCYIWTQNHTRRMVLRSRECVINVPTAEMAKTVVDIGNCSGADIDKFAHFKLTPQKAEVVGAPMIGECYASFECRLRDDSLVKKYSLFVWEIVAAHVAQLKNPQTMHYRGHGIFLLGGRQIDLSRRFKPEML